VEPGVTVVRIPTHGPFRLDELGTFGYGHLHAQPWDGVWRLAFVVDGGRGHAGVAVRQVSAEELELTIEAPSWRWGSTIRCSAG
jgi:hypothetical protein